MQQRKEWLKTDQENLIHAMAPAKASPLIVKRAQGCIVEDIDGNEFIDAMSGLWCVNAGYGREELAKAAYDQINELTYYPMSHSHLPAIELSEKLNDWLGGEYVFFFSNSGSEANETTFKIARQFHEQNGNPGKFKVVSRYRAYHGNTFGALAATGQAQRKYKYEPLSTGFIHTVPPDCYHCPLKMDPETCGLACADAIDQVISWELEQTVAAVIMEPYITGGGVIIPPKGYLEKVSEICKKHDVLLIVDEVITGFGRTGEKFGFMHENIKPDIITMAKGITSGYMPLSATAVKKDLFELFKDMEEYGHFRHVNTFGGHPAACAVAIKNMDIIERENLVSRAEQMGALLFQEVEKNLKDHQHVGDIRSKGLLLGIELVQDRRARTPLSDEQVNRVIRHCKEKGVIIGKNGVTVENFNNVLTIAPPLSIDKQTILTISDVVQSSIKEELQ